MQPQPSRPPVGLAFVGCGNVLPAYLASAIDLSRAGAARVVAFCGRERQREELERQWPEATFHTDYAAMLRQPGVDVVVVLTPMPDHASIASRALAAGKHVLVEKPMATAVEEGKKLVALAKRKGLHLFCAPFTALSPTFRIIGALLRSGDIGRVATGRARYGWAGPDWRPWFYRAGGGVIHDLGVYSLTTLTGWLGPVRRVQAMVGVSVPERDVEGKRVRVEAEDNAQILLDFGGGCFISVTTSFSIQQYQGPGVELYGTEGTIHLLGDDWDPDGYEIWRNRAGCWQRFKETAPDWHWTDGLRHLVACIRGVEEPRLRLDHVLHVLDVIRLAKESSAKGRALEVRSRFEPLDFGEAAAAVDTGAGGSGGIVEAHRVHDRTRGSVRF